MANCLIGLGSNLGDRGAHLEEALEQLRLLTQTQFGAASSFRDTQPAGGPQSQAPYLNAAATIETSLTPQQMLAELQRIEIQLGRVREERWGPRTIDLDLLLFDQIELETPELTLPHPRMSFRRFVLEPAAEIAAEMVYPINGWTIAELLAHSNKGLRRICLAPHCTAQFPRSPATSLLNALISLPEVFFDYWSGVDQLAARRKRVKPTNDEPSHHAEMRWVISDGWPGQTIAEFESSNSGHDEFLAEHFERMAEESLVVVFEPESDPYLKLLNVVRRFPQCGPVLWIPGIPLDVARQEVIAAMAAME
jgi:2-amino-4-hydroxy-6-hydroxymethyldihydropteridine diphosphokinase